MEEINTTNNSLAENKVLILYTLNTINRDITETDLLKIISSINNINYFYFRDILIDLVNSKLIGTYTKDEQTVYEITSEGKNSLELTIDMLPGIIKLKADNILKQELISIVNEDSITAEYIPENEKFLTKKEMTYCRALFTQKLKRIKKYLEQCERPYTGAAKEINEYVLCTESLINRM